MGIRIHRGGLFTTIQDGGRKGFQSYGFSVSGAMDMKSLRIANILLDNPETEAAIEVTLLGPEIEFTADISIAITGGDLQPSLNGRPIPMYQPVTVRKGDVLSFQYVKSGCRSYIAFAGGLDLPAVMGSRSTSTKYQLGGFHGRTLAEGDTIAFCRPRIQNKPKDKLRTKLDPREHAGKEAVLRVIEGPQEEAFTSAGRQAFFTSPYTVTNEFDRMGCRLEGEAIPHKKGADIISDGIFLGAVQVPPSGKPIIMLADRQTTGGYTKIGSVCLVDIPKLVQRKPGDTIYFKKISIQEAQRLLRAEEAYFASLKEPTSFLGKLFNRRSYV